MKDNISTLFVTMDCLFIPQLKHLKEKMMNKLLATIAVFFFATTFNATAASNLSGADQALQEEQIKEQQDMKRKETLDDMQAQAHKRKQQLQQQSAEVQRHQERLGLESDKSSGKK